MVLGAESRNLGSKSLKSAFGLQFLKQDQLLTFPGDDSSTEDEVVIYSSHFRKGVATAVFEGLIRQEKHWYWCFYTCRHLICAHWCLN